MDLAPLTSRHAALAHLLRFDSLTAFAMRIPVLIVTATLLASCTPGNDTPNASRTPAEGGTLIVSVAADVDFLVPPIVAQQMGTEARDVLFDRLAELGDDMNTAGDKGFTPCLAERWDWAPDSLSIAFHLNPRARWHDAKPVTASDVRFTYKTYVDPAIQSPNAAVLANIDSVTIRDSLTAVYWFKRRYAEQFFDATYQMHIMPQHLLGALKPDQVKTSEFARKPVGTGRFRFARHEPGSMLEVVADSANYRGRPRLDRIVWSIAPDPTVSAARVLTGEADLGETLRAADAPELAKHPELRWLRYAGYEHGYLVFNLFDGPSARPHPIFSELAVRRALSMAIDRKRVVQNVFDSLAVVSYGPFTRAQSSADTTIATIPYDVEGANRLLDSAGWKPGPDGIRQKNGHALRFGIIHPTSSMLRARMAVLMQEMFKRVGAIADIEPLEINVAIERGNAYKFDATLMTVTEDPSPSTIRQTWSAQAAKHGDNIARYQSAAFDAAVDSGVFALSVPARKAHFRRAYEIIVADAPAIWMHEPVKNLIINSRVSFTRIRPDAWWVAVAEWRITGDRRKPADKGDVLAKR